MFLNHLLKETEIPIGNNGSRRIVHRTKDSLWPYYRSLKRFFGWCVQEGYIAHNPMDGIKVDVPKDPPIDPWRPEHISKMVHVLEQDWKVAKTPRQRMLAARDQAIFSLFLESFIRLDELAELKVEDIDIDKKRLLVRKGKMGKGRWTGFGPKTQKCLWRYLGLRQNLACGNELWLTEEGSPLSSRGIQEIFRRLKREAGLQQIKGSIHKMRHTGATTTLKHTRDMKGLKLLLGHETLAMTERYTQFIEAQDALKAYDGQGPLDWIND
jgi:site-specific recombinase XerC